MKSLKLWPEDDGITQCPPYKSKGAHFIPSSPYMPWILSCRSAVRKPPISTVKSVTSHALLISVFEHYDQNVLLLQTKMCMSTVAKNEALVIMSVRGIVPTQKTLQLE